MLHPQRRHTRFVTSEPIRPSADDQSGACLSRKSFEERLNQALAKAKSAGEKLTVMVIDLDHFSELNGLLGHKGGDALLCIAAIKIGSRLTGCETFARIGNDEFAVLIPGAKARWEVEQYVCKVNEALHEISALNDHAFFVSASTGVAVFPDDAADVHGLIYKAELDLRSAKRMGEEKAELFTNQYQQMAQHQLGKELQNAVSDGSIVAHFQPIVDIATGKIMKAEALARWTHPVFGTIGPSEFMPLAEKYGFISEVSEVIFKNAALLSRRCSEIVKAEFPIAVNLTPRQFVFRNPCSEWSNHLAEIGLSSRCIQIEITEDTMLPESQVVNQAFDACCRHGMQIAVDDFGTGFSSISYLNRFDFDYLKIDPSFTRELTESEKCRAIVETIIFMAHKLSIKVVAEGIETRDQLNFLSNLGCDYAQGHYFSEAIPADSFVELIEANSTESHSGDVVLQPEIALTAL